MSGKSAGQSDDTDNIRRVATTYRLDSDLCADQYDLFHNDPSIKNVTSLKNVVSHNVAYSHGIHYTYSVILSTGLHLVTGLYLLAVLVVIVNKHSAS